MKRFIVVLLCVLVAVCGLAAQAKPKQVAVCLPGSVEFFAVERKGMDQAAAKYNLALTYSDAEWDAGKQLNQVENFVTKGVDAIMLCARDPQALLPAVKMCKDAKIPLITFTNTLGPDPMGQYPGVVTFIGINDTAYGIMMGQMAAKLLGDKAANIVLIEGEPGTSAQRQRSDGFRAELAKNPKYKIIYSQAIPGWTKEGSLAAMEAFLQKGQQFDLVAAEWTDGAVAASKAIREAGLKGKFVTALEYSKAVEADIKAGNIHMTAYASIINMGFLAVETTAKYLTGQKVPPFVEVVPVFVDKTNVGQHVPEM
jgi:ribose transport system substrate-binding protein